MTKDWWEKNKHKRRTPEYRAKKRAQYRSYQEDHYVVYYIPREHYCGITIQPKARMTRHRTDGFDTTGWRVLACADTREEALILEAEFHLMGMNGMRGIKHIPQTKDKE